MPNKIQFKRSTTGGVVPTTGNIDIAELAINTADKKVYTSNGTAVFEVGSNLSSLSVGGGKLSGNTTNAYVDGIPIATSNTRDSVANNGTLIGTRSRINFIPGTNVTLNISDDSAGNQVNVTISSTAGGGSGSPGGSNTQIQFNDSTSFGGSAGLTFDKTANLLFVSNSIITGAFNATTANVGYLTLGANVTLDGTTNGFIYIGNSTVNSILTTTYLTLPVENILSPTTPANNQMKLTMVDGAMHRLAVVDEWGEEDFMQSSFGQKSIAFVQANPATAAPSAVGVAIANTLAYTTRAPAITSRYTMTKRTGITSNTTAGTSAEHRSSVLYLTRGNTAGGGGFLFEVKFGIAAISTNYRFFCGLKDSVAVLANGNPSAQTNLIGVGIDSTQTTLRVISNDNTGTANTIDLGANYPTNTGNTYFYLARFWCPPNASFINYNVRRLDTDFTSQGTFTASGDLPQNTVFLAPKVWVNNGTDATAVGIDLMSWYSEQTY